MSGWRRFRGSLLAAAVLAALWGVWQLVADPAERAPMVSQERLFAFEKEALVGFRVARPEGTLEVRQEEGRWRVVGQPWRPSRSMIRRVAHQLHDLSARAEVVHRPGDFTRYGLGAAGVEVTLWLEDGRQLQLQVGDPNPTGVSWYVRPMPGERVYVVKKAAVDYFRLPDDAFREDRFAAFEASEARSLVVETEGRRLVLQREGPRRWQQTEPVAQRASRDQVRRMLGRLSAMKALAFVDDEPTDLGRYGLEPPEARITVTLEQGEPVTLWAGHRIGGEPESRYVMRLEDRAIYEVRDGFLEVLAPSDEALRDEVLLGRQGWEVHQIELTLDKETVGVRKTADTWRWSDGSAVAGSTPKRLASMAAELRAVGFPAPADFAPVAEVSLVFDDGTERRLSLGPRQEVLEAGGAVERQLARADGDPVVYEIDGRLGRVLDDLHRESLRTGVQQATGSEHRP